MEIKPTVPLQKNIAINKSTVPSEAEKPKVPVPEIKISKQEPQQANVNDKKAVFAIQDDKYVVIQFLDKDGEVVKQIPAKELINAYERLQESIKNHYDEEA